jgi:vancomycin resistance protein YoaR
MVTAKKAAKKEKPQQSRDTRTLRDRFAVHYGPYVPHKKHHRVILWIVGCVLVVVIGVQLAYPRDRALPLASIPGKTLSFATYDESAKAIEEAFNNSRIKLVVGADKEEEFDIKTVGAEPDTERMIARLRDYELWQRFIPGSILWQPAQLSTADVYFANTQFTKFIDTVSKELSFAPTNARLALDKGRVVASEAIEGSEVSSKGLLEVMSEAPIILGRTTVISVPAERVPAELGSHDLEQVRGQAEAALAHTVAITANDERFLPSKDEVASWILLTTDKKGQVTLTVDKPRVKSYIAGLNKKVGTPAGQTNITIVDGRETGRTTGKSGRAINSDSLIKELSAALLKAEPREIELAASFVTIKPSVIYNSKYTATEAGLQAYANDVARTRNMHISIQQLTGEKWKVNARATESIPSASTYKLFLALVLFDRIDKGEIKWTDPMLDTTVAGCFERMTVASTNPCAEKWIAMFGREYINKFIYARGFSKGTSFTTGGANQTTAADLTKYMIGLNNGSLVSGANRARLLDSLGRHPYRYGIPTGSAGVVHDKVGFLWDYVHDTGIVQHKRGTYIMTVMTKGQSYAAIAAVTREVERIMYP